MQPPRPLPLAFLGLAAGVLNVYRVMQLANRK